VGAAATAGTVRADSEASAAERGTLTGEATALGDDEAAAAEAADDDDADAVEGEAAAATFCIEMDAARRRAALCWAICC
jgi:hypothetical protein